MNAPAVRATHISPSVSLVLRSGVSLATGSDDAFLAGHSQLYFAYGADISEALLRRRCPEAEVIGCASLRGFGLTFAGASKNWGGATLTLVPTASGHVDGVLYRLPNLSLAGLDRIQGCPRVYDRVTVCVADHGGALADAHAYCMRPPLGISAPSDSYFDLVAREYHRLGLDPEPLVVALDRAVNSSSLARSRR